MVPSGAGTPSLVPLQVMQTAPLQCVQDTSEVSQSFLQVFVVLIDVLAVSPLQNAELSLLKWNTQ